MFYLILFLCCSGAWLSVHHLLNFQGWYGPAGIKSISAFFQGDYSWDEYTRLLYHLHAWTELDPIFISYAISYVGYIMTCFGVAVLAQQWFSIRYPIIPSLILYAPLVMIGQLIGPDAICIGLIFLGLGVAKRLFPISAIAWISSAQIKSIGLPALTLFPIIHPWTWAAIPFLIPFALPTIEYLPQHTTILLSKATTLFLVLFATSTLVFFSKKKRFRNIAIVVLLFGSCVYVSLKMSTKLRPRYLIAPTLPLIIVATGHLKNLRFGNPALAIFWLFLGCDTWSFLYQWDQKFVLNEAKTPSAIPRPPTRILAISSVLTDLVHSDHSAKGAQSLQKMGKNITKGGIVELRDTRHHHLIAPLAQHKKHFRIVSPQNCCKPSETLHACALRTLQEFNQSGGTLVLPSSLGHRIKEQRAVWIQTLIEEAQAFPTFQKYDPWWLTLTAQYHNRSMPCTSKK